MLNCINTINLAGGQKLQDLVMTRTSAAMYGPYILQVKAVAYTLYRCINYIDILVRSKMNEHLKDDRTTTRANFRNCLYCILGPTAVPTIV